MKTHIIIKKIFLFTLGIILGISLIGCSSLKKKTSEDSPPALTSDGVAIVPAASQNTPPTGTGETVTVVPTDAAPPPGSVTPVENTPAVSPSSTSTTPQTSIEVGTTRDKNIQSVNCNVPQESSEVQAGYPADNTNMATGGASFEMPANQSDSFDRGLIPDGLNNFSREENVSPAEIVTAGTGSSEGSFQNASLGGTNSSETKENVSGADGVDGTGKTGENAGENGVSPVTEVKDNTGTPQGTVPVTSGDNGSNGEKAEAADTKDRTVMVPGAGSTVLVRYANGYVAPQSKLSRELPIHQRNMIQQRFSSGQSEETTARFTTTVVPE